MKYTTRKNSNLLMFYSFCILLILIGYIIGVFFVNLPLYSNSFNFTNLTHTLPIVNINTQNNVLPKDKENYVNCGFKISNTEKDFEIVMKENYGSSNSVGIRLRGNSTMTFDKKPFKLKFDKKQSFFGSSKSKNWVLLADYLDITLIKNYTALSLASKFDNMAWNPVGNHVVLYLNEKYQGVYLLADQIDEKDARLGIEDDRAYLENQEEYPFLVEISEDTERDLTVDRNDIFYVNSFISTPSQAGKGQPAEIKYPEYSDGRPNDATIYIKNYVNEVFDALFTGDLDKFEELVDINSFIDYVLLMENTANSDAVWKSIYISKKVGEKNEVWSGMGF